MTGISVCTVTLRSDIRYCRIWLESLRDRSLLVDDVIVVDVAPIRHSIKGQLSEIWGSEINYCPIDVPPYVGHTIGLHAGIERARNDFMILSDPDVFFFMPGFDRFMLDLHQEHGLMFTGVTHWNWRGQAFQHFPTVVNMLIRKQDLPPKDFLAGKMLLGRTTYKARRSTKRSHPGADGFWLGRGAVLDTYKNYPRPDLCFDTGCNLYEWARQRDGRWLAFTNSGEEDFIKTFTTENVNNFGLVEDFGRRRLLYHQCRAFSAIEPSERKFAAFKSAYKLSKRAAATVGDG